MRESFHLNRQVIDAEAIVEFGADGLPEIRVGNRIVVADVSRECVATGRYRPNVEIVNAGDAGRFSDR